MLIDALVQQELGHVATGIVGMSSLPEAIELFLNRRAVEMLFGKRN